MLNELQATGSYVPSVASRSLEDAGDKGDAVAQEAVRGVTASIYAGGS